MQDDPAWTGQWIRTLTLTWATEVLSSPLRKCIPKHLKNPFYSLLALLYQTLDGWISRLVQLVHCNANIAQHDQCMTNSLFHPVALSQTCSNFYTETRILWFYSIQMLFSSFLIFISCFSQVLNPQGSKFWKPSISCWNGGSEPLRPAASATSGLAKWKREVRTVRIKIKHKNYCKIEIIFSIFSDTLKIIKHHQIFWCNRWHHTHLWNPRAAVLLHNPIEHLRSTFLSFNISNSKKHKNKTLHMIQHW